MIMDAMRHILVKKWTLPFSDRDKARIEIKMSREEFNFYYQHYASKDTKLFCEKGLGPF